MRNRLIIGSLLALIAAHLGAEDYREGGVTIAVGRVLTGSVTGARYYGYDGGKIVLPHARGGLLAFDLWNDMSTGGTSVTNDLNATVGASRIKIVNYATHNQFAEEYAELRGAWGPAGISRITLAIPPGTDSVTFDNAGSDTGIELSGLKFIEGYRPIPGGFERSELRPSGAPIVETGRVLKGIKTGRQYYGYQSGTIHLSHANGGFLSFKLYNDQAPGFATTTNKINISVGGRTESFVQYTTALDLEEFFAGLENQWGPAGGSSVSIQIPEGTTKVEFNNGGSETGIEVSEVQFTKGAPVVFDFKEHLNRSSEVLKDFGRVLRGASSGRQYYGYSSGRVALPNTKGGVLTFRIWNDHGKGTAQVANQLNVKAGQTAQTERQMTAESDRPEFYTELPDAWGPAGGRTVQVNVPAGIALVEFNNTGSATGVELSDFMFRGN